MDRKIEEAIAKAESVGELYRICRDAMKERLGSYRGLAVLSLEPDGKLVLRKLTGLSPEEFSTGGAHDTLLQAVRNGGEAHLILDARRYSSLDFGGQPGFASAVCLPVSGSNGRVRGVMLADHDTRTGAFNQSQLKVLQEVAAAVGCRQEELEAAPTTRVEEPASPPPVKAMAGIALILVGGLYLSIMVLSGAGPAPLPSPTPIAQTPSPTRIAHDYLSRIRREQYGEAYQMLSASVRSRVSRDSYRAHLKSWVENEDHRWQLQSRQTGAGAEDGDRAIVTLAPPPGQEQTWEWTLTREQDEWGLSSFQGGPPLPRE